MAQDRAVYIRLGVKDADKAIAALRSAGIEGEKALGRFQAAGEKASAGLRAVDGAVDDLRGRALGLSAGLGPIGASLSALGPGGLAAAAGIGAAAAALTTLISAGDKMTAIEGRLKAATGSAGAAADAYDKIYKAALLAGTGIDQAVGGFTRFNIAARSIGATQTEVARLVDIVQKFGVVGGASAQETAAGVQQLGQALASGRLQGDELRSILENMPMLGDALAQSLGRGIGELREMGTAGELTSEKVFAALLAKGADADRLFAELGLTGERAGQMLETAWNRLAGEIDKSLGLSQAYARTLAELAGYVERVRVSGTAPGQLEAAKTELAAVNAEIEKAGKLTRGLEGVFGATEWTKNLETRRERLTKQIETLEQATKAERDLAAERERADKAGADERKAAAAAEAAKKRTAALGELNAEQAREIELARMSANAREQAIAADKAEAELKKKLADVKATASSDEIKAARERAIAATQAKQATEAAASSSKKADTERRQAAEQATREAEREAKRRQDASDAIDRQVQGLRDETAGLALSDRQREIHNELLRAEEIARRGGTKVTDTQRESIEKETGALYDRRQAAEAAKDAEKLRVEANKKAAEEIERQAQEAGDDLVRIGADAIESIFDADKPADFFKSVLDYGRAAFARLAAEAIIRPIVQPVVGQVVGALAGAGGYGGTAGGVGSAGNAVGMVGQVGNLASSAGMLGGVGSWASGVMGTTLIPGTASGAIAQSGSLAAAYTAPGAAISGSAGGMTVGGLVGGVGAGFGAGMLLNGLVGGNQTGGMVGSAAGAIAGAVVGSVVPVIGTFLGALIGGAGGGLLGGLFGGGGPSNKEGNATVSLGTGRLTVGGQTGDKFSKENRDAAQAAADTMLQLGRVFEELSADGAKLTGTLKIIVGDRDGMFAVLDGVKKKFERTEAGVAEMIDYVASSFAGQLGDALDADVQTALEKIDFSDLEQALLDINLAATFRDMFDPPKVIGPLEAAAGQLGEAFKQAAKDAARLGLDTAEMTADFAGAVKRLVESQQAVGPLAATLADLDKALEAARKSGVELGADVVAAFDGAREQIKANFAAGLEAQIRDASGRGYLNQVGAMVAEFQANAAELAAAGMPAAKATELLSVRLGALFAQLDAGQVAEAVVEFGNLSGAIGQAANAAAEAASAAARQAAEAAAAAAAEAQRQAAEAAARQAAEAAAAAQRQAAEAATALADAIGGKLNEALGRGYVNQAAEFLAEFNANLEALELIGRPTAEAAELLAVRFRALFAALEPGQIAEVVARFGSLSGVIGQLAGEAAAATEAAARQAAAEAAATARKAQLDAAAAAAADAERQATAALESAKSALVSTIQREASAAADAARKWSDLGRTLRQSAAALRLDGTLSPLNPADQLAEARAQYQDVARRAAGGDETAAAQLPDAARAFLEASRAYNADQAAYMRDFDEVQRTLARTATVAEREAAAAARQAETLEAQLVQLGVINESVLTVAAALKAYQDALAAQQKAAANAAAAAAGAANGTGVGYVPAPGSYTKTPGGIESGGTKSVSDQLAGAYQAFLGRTGTPSELAFWAAEAARTSVAQAVANIATSKEAQNKLVASATKKGTGGFLGAGELGLVGETGRPELVFGPAYVANPDVTRRMMGGAANDQHLGAGLAQLGRSIAGASADSAAVMGSQIGQLAGAIDRMRRDLELFARKRA